MSASAAKPSPVPFTKDQNWTNLFHKQPTRSWYAYLGKWGRYPIEGGTTPIREFDGVRQFYQKGDGSFDHYNIYSMQTPGSEPRLQDEGFSKRWDISRHKHNFDDGWYHPYLQPQYGPMRCRTVAPSPGRITTACYSLPLAENLAQHDPKPPFAGGENFFRAPDEMCSWSGGPMYNTATGEFMSIFYIREYSVPGVDPDSGPYQLTNRPEVREARPLLPEDPAEWLGGGSDTWKGIGEEVHFADGAMSHVAEHAASWAAPEPSYQLARLPDSFYVSFRRSMPVKKADIPPEGVWIEMGGLTSPTTFRKARVHYDANGNLQKIRHEEFTQA